MGATSLQWERVAHKEDFSRSSHGQGQSGTTAPLSPPQRTCQQKLTLVFVPPLSEFNPITLQRSKRACSQHRKDEQGIPRMAPCCRCCRILPHPGCPWFQRLGLEHCSSGGGEVNSVVEATACSQNLGCAPLSSLSRGTMTLLSIRRSKSYRLCVWRLTSKSKFGSVQ